FSPIRRSSLYFADSRLLIAFPFKTLHPEPEVPNEGNAPSSGLLFRDLTGFPTHALRKNPRDTSNDSAGHCGPAFALTYAKCPLKSSAVRLGDRTGCLRGMEWPPPRSVLGFVLGLALALRRSHLVELLFAHGLIHAL